MKSYKNFDVITIGTATRDTTFYTNELKLIDNKGDLLRQKLIAFEYGAKISVPKIHQSFGGGAANAAVAFCRLGLKAGIISRVGEDDAGQSIIKNLRAHGVDADLTQVDQKEPTAFSFIVAHEKTHERTIFTYRGAAARLNLHETDFKKADAAWFYLSALSGKQWPANLAIIFKKSRLNGAKVAWNPGAPQLAAGIGKLQKFITKTEILILNKDEALELVSSDSKHKNKKFVYLNNIKNLLLLLGEYGARITLITDGRRGAWAFDGERRYFTPALGKKGVDLTGVGDAFGSSFTAGLIKFNDIDKAMKIAAINAGSVCMKAGAQNGLMGWGEMREKLGKNT